jgi:hypothetical protein
VPAFHDLGARHAQTQDEAAPESWSIVIAVVAVSVGVRAGICMIAVPTLMRLVWAAIQQSGETASEP